MEFEFTFVVSGVNVDDNAVVAKLHDEFDAMLFRGGGRDLLTVAAEGENALMAAIQVKTAISHILPELRIHHLDQDLVGVHEIAERTCRSRQNVSQWVTGERRLGGRAFPSPEGTAGRSRVWLWSEVNAWLEEHGIDDGVHYPSRDEMTEIDHAVNHTVTLTIQDLVQDEFAEDRSAVLSEFQPWQLTQDFMGYLTGKEHLTDRHGRYVMVVAAAKEPARAVMERLASHGHDVLFVTVTDRLVVMSMSTNAPNRPVEVVDVPADATVHDWVHLILNNPGAGFVLTDDAEVTPLSTLLVEAA